MKLATRKDKIKIIKSLPLALSLSGEERCEMLACLLACLLLRRSEDVSIFFGRASVHCEDLLDYWFHSELPEEVC
jgi:hypothetical protein